VKIKVIIVFFALLIGQPQGVAPTVIFYEFFSMFCAIFLASHPMKSHWEKMKNRRGVNLIVFFLHLGLRDLFQKRRGLISSRIVNCSLLIAHC
jgi:hypothetical protein